MRILVCHPYLLRGTGGSRYVQSLARSLCARGHQLLLVCQEGDPRLDFVSSFVEESGGGPVLAWEQETPYPGNCMVYRPDIGGLLPVHVLDPCPGLRVKEFTAMEDGELERYVELNRAALDRLLRQFAPDVLHINHAVMLPYAARPVAGEWGVPYFVSVHGPEIDLTVRRDERYLEYGARGLEGARAVLVPGEHARGQVLEVFGRALEGTGARLELLVPGVDTDLFRPAEAGFRESAERVLEATAARTAGVTVADFRGRSAEGPGEGGPLDIASQVERINGLHPEWMPDVELGWHLPELAEAGNPFFIHVGRLLESSGVQCIVPALPLLLAERPSARLVIVGSGELRGLLELMIQALDAGEIRRFRLLCEHGNEAYDERTPGSFAPVLGFLETLASEGNMDEFVRLCLRADIAAAITFTGYLAPEEYSLILPHARALLLPSLDGETSGAEAAEAMACGVVPVAGHPLPPAIEASVNEAWGEDAAGLRLGTPEKMVFRVAAACRTVIDLSPGMLAGRGALLRATAERALGWDAAAGRLLEIYESGSGEVDDVR